MRTPHGRNTNARGKNGVIAPGGINDNLELQFKTTGRAQRQTGSRIMDHWLSQSLVFFHVPPVWEKDGRNFGLHHYLEYMGDRKIKKGDSRGMGRNATAIL